jgi:hypothetical protein
MNLYEMIPMTYRELKVVRSLVERMRGDQLCTSLELDSMAEKLDAATRRINQRMLQESKDAESTRCRYLSLRTGRMCSSCPRARWSQSAPSRPTARC